MKRLTTPLGVIAGAAVFAAAMSMNVEAQKGAKPKPPASYPGTADFQCDLAEADLCPDGLIGDGSVYPGTGANETGAGAHLTGSNGELWLGPGAAGFTLTFDFRGQAGACGASCRWDWVNDQRYTATSFEIQSNVVDGPAGAEVAGGLLSIPEGGSGYARFKISFAGPTAGYLLDFDSQNTPESTAVVVTRTAVCTWEFTDGGALAFMKSGVRRDRIDEGVFSVPFRLTLTAPGCVPGS